MKPMHPARVIALLVATAMVTAGVRMQGCNLPAWPTVLTPPKVAAVTYVHDEKAAVPSGVRAALNELNARNILATAFADDATDGDDQVPEQYRLILPAAKAVGIPALVVSGEGGVVLRTVRGPTTKDQVLEAAR